MERLQKFMAACGVASRRKCEEIITDGRVKVNGAVVDVLGTTVDTLKDVVTVDGKKITRPVGPVYIMLYKPDAVVSTASDPEGRKTVLDCVSHESRLYPVGRLDYHTEGLILLTNDGEAAYRLTHPKYEIEKEYIAVIKGQVSRPEILKLQSGVVIDGVKTAPSKVAVVDMSEHTITLSVIIHEGRNRQVRRMCGQAGVPVERLARVQEGNLKLGDLPAGKWRYLTEAEVNMLKGEKSDG